MMDIFQYSNVYAVKPEITRLFDLNNGLAQECLRYVRIEGEHPKNTSMMLYIYIIQNRFK
jgi:hypothetical protein